MRIIGKPITQKEAAEMSPGTLLQKTMYLAASLEERHTKVAERDLKICVAEVLTRMNMKAVLAKDLVYEPGSDAVKAIIKGY